jgi:hypothetical protein
VNKYWNIIIRDMNIFEDYEKVHDWRNYVIYEWKNNWNQFTEREKKIIYAMAKEQSDSEDWD